MKLDSSSASLSQSPWAKHWIGPLAFVPFAILFVIHRRLGLSDALLAAPAPGQPFWPVYNLVMGILLYAGLLVYLAHTFWMADQGWFWVVLKCAAFVVCWTVLRYFM
ncbi:MAG: hypothetical protein K8T25_20820 [Planctomycetia bacterium]|nr:hypothetical protein [Planctomycetia bacterium]